MTNQEHSAMWAEWVRRNREARNWSKRTLAAKVGVDPSYVTLWENDGYVPMRKKVQHVADAFGLPRAEAEIIAGLIPETMHIVRLLKEVRREK